MKISKTEKLILAVLLGLLVGILYFNTLFRYERSKISILGQQKEKVNEKLENIKTQISSVDDIKKNIKVLNYKIDEGPGRLYPKLDEYKLLLELDKLYSKANLTGDVSFVEVSSEDSDSLDNADGTSSDSETSNVKNKNAAVIKKLNGLVVQYNSNVLKKSSSTDIASDESNSVQANITFKGSYNNVMKFLSNIESNKYQIAVSGFTLGGGDASSLSGTAVLQFYSIPQFADMNTDYGKWNYNDKYGKTNPFSPKAQTSANTSLVPSKEDSLDSDFAMSIKSINSDLPAVMLGKYKDPQRQSYIYEDENKTENMEIVITEKNNKFYYKYKSKDNSYPAEYDGDGNEFTPQGEDIAIVIYSSKRTSSTDEAAVNLTVVNNASKNIDVNIYNDDTTRPRVTINSKGGNVQTINK